MQIALGSIFRNSTSYLDRYFSQVEQLKNALSKRGHGLRLLLAEGDSTDKTWDTLQRLARKHDTEIIKREHGDGRDYGHMNHTARWQNISYACNGVLELVAPTDGALIYVESDLLWEADTMLALMSHLGAASAIAPMCFGPDGSFYDVWGHRKDGLCFNKERPYHPAINGRLTEIDSAGSCLVMRGQVARVCRFDPPEKGIVGFCENMQASGYQLWLDPALEVHHP